MFLEAIRAYLGSLGLDTANWTNEELLEHMNQVLREIMYDRDNLEYTLTELMNGIQEHVLTVAAVLSEEPTTRIQHSGTNGEMLY